VLIRHLPRDSAFKLAASDYDWPLEAHLATGAWNEIKAMRGDLWALIGGDRLPFKPVLAPSTERKQQAKREVVRAMHDETMAQLRGG
jgi:hypothetical protein